MRYIRIKNDLMSIGGIIKSGTILPVEAINGRWRVTEGKFEGVLINGYECEVVYSQSEYTDLYQELMNSRAEVHELKRERDALLQTIERAIEGQKPVKLPREVVEELDKVRSKYRPDGDHWKWQVLKILFYKDGLPHTRKKTGVNQLLTALVNGYEGEGEELETYTTNRKLDKEEIKQIRLYYEGAKLREQDGTDKDGFAREAIEEVALYLGGAELLKDVSRFCANQIERENASSGR